MKQLFQFQKERRDNWQTCRNFQSICNQKIVPGADPGGKEVGTLLFFTINEFKWGHMVITHPHFIHDWACKMAGHAPALSLIIKRARGHMKHCLPFSPVFFHEDPVIYTYRDTEQKLLHIFCYILQILVNVNNESFHQSPRNIFTICDFYIFWNKTFRVDFNIS